MWAGKQRLLSLAAHLDAWNACFPQPLPYDSRQYFYPDGKPSDAAGLWAVMNPDRWDVYRGPFKPYPYPALRNLDDLLTPALRASAKGYTGPSIRTVWSLMFDFDLPLSDVQLIFGTGGCAGAKKWEHAARYIRGFVEGYEQRLKEGLES